MLDLLKDKLLKTVSEKKDESKVFYFKMCGDYYRYLAELKPECNYKNNAKKFYEKAMEMAQEILNETHPTRLELALNLSVCYYEILKQPQKACEMAKKYLDAAMKNLTCNDGNPYKDSTLIMQLLRDNLTLWNSGLHCLLVCLKQFI